MAQIRQLKEHEAEQVRDLWLQMCTEVGASLSEASSQLILANLRKYATHQQVRCFVVQDQQQLIGFVTCSIQNHPVMPGVTGEIEELYVQPHSQRGDLRVELVRQAVLFMQAQGAGSIHTRICTGEDCPEEKDLRVFWDSLGWENDMTIFSIYGNVPGNSALQHVWDAYQVTHN